MIKKLLDVKREQCINLVRLINLSNFYNVTKVDKYDYIYNKYFNEPKPLIEIAEAIIHDSLDITELQIENLKNSIYENEYDLPNIQGYVNMVNRLPFKSRTRHFNFIRHHYMLDCFKNCYNNFKNVDIFISRLNLYIDRLVNLDEAMEDIQGAIYELHNEIEEYINR